MDRGCGLLDNDMAVCQMERDMAEMEGGPMLGRSLRGLGFEKNVYTLDKSFFKIKLVIYKL